MRGSRGGTVMGSVDHGGGGGGSGSDSGDQMDADTRARELARRKEEAKRRRRKKKRTGSSLVSSCFQGKNRQEESIKARKTCKNKNAYENTYQRMP